jgi:hypothetical protein
MGVLFPSYFNSLNALPPSREKIPRKPITTRKIMTRESNWILNPSDFAFLWEECRRCFYLKVVSKFPRPRTPMPGVFRQIDSQMREFYAGKQTNAAMPFLPAGTIDTSDSRVKSEPISLPGHDSTLTIRGVLDTLIRFDDTTFGVVDFKTLDPKREHTLLYSRQLHGYAVALERAAHGSLCLSPVTKLGLVVFEPFAFLARHDLSASLTGRLRWIEIARNDENFFTFLKEVLNTLELPEPPPSSLKCQWCRYRKTARTTGL